MVPKASGVGYNSYLKLTTTVNGVLTYSWVALSGSSTVVVTSLDTVTSPDTDTNYLIAWDNGYYCYRYINNGWHKVGDGANQVLVVTTLPTIQNADTNADYYLLNNGQYIHYRVIDGAF